MWNARLGGGLQVEVLPDLYKLILTNLANQDDWHLDFCGRSRPVSRRWPFVRDDRRVHIFPAELCPHGIGEDIVGLMPNPPPCVRAATNLTVSCLI
jgi:hypothetical protein